MWFALVLYSALAAAPPDGRVSPGSPSQPKIFQIIAARFPGAKPLAEADFASTVVGRSFRYRDIGSGIVIHSPGEFFGKDGRYSFGHRSISHGAYLFKQGVVLIEGTHGSFLGLGHERLFFRHRGRLLTTGGVGGSSVLEMVPKPSGSHT